MVSLHDESNSVTRGTMPDQWAAFQHMAPTLPIMHLCYSVTSAFSYEQIIKIDTAENLRYCLFTFPASFFHFQNLAPTLPTIQLSHYL